MDRHEGHRFKVYTRSNAVFDEGLKAAKGVITGVVVGLTFWLCVFALIYDAVK